MDSEQFHQLPTAPYPAPPSFWKHFTSGNIERMKEIRANVEIPYTLNFLRPPPPPSVDADTYTTFAIPVKLDPTPALPPPEILLFNLNSLSFDHGRALKQLTNSLLLNFLELITILSNDPVKYEEKMQDVERLMLNVHFVINLYRPHQAREGVKEMLQDQLDRGKNEIEKCDKLKKRVEDYMEDIGQQKTALENMTQKNVAKADMVETKELWSLIHSLKGD